MAFGIFLSLNSLFAQNELFITGKVYDVKRDPIIGAAISTPIQNQGAITDLDGNFSIKTSPGTKLSISYLGYRTRTITVKDTTTVLNIRLREDQIQLGDVVVVGYGSQKKESLTGSVSKLKTEEIMSTKAPSLAQALQGKVAGLRIRQENGEPGVFSSNINIRGFGTPLFIIDGVVRDGAGEFQRLNPEDIESISFLKDATAAIYGMNSGNGAVVITTKKGIEGKPRISLNGNYGISKPTEIPKMVNAAQYQIMMNEASVNAGGTPLFTQDELDKWITGTPGYESHNLYPETFRSTAPQYQTTLSIEGGTDKIRYFGSLGYAGEESFLKKNSMSYDKYTFRSNVSLNVTKDLVASVNLGGRYDKRKAPNIPFFDIFRSTRINPPTQGIYANGNPNYYNYFSYVTNPVAWSDKDYSGYNNEDITSIQTQFILEYNVPFIKDLKLKGMLNYDFTDRKAKGVRRAFDTYTYFKDTEEYVANAEVETSSISYSDNDMKRLDMQFQAIYNTTIKQNHNIAATYVFERREETTRSVGVGRFYDFYTNDEIDFGRENGQTMSGTSEDKAYLSHIGRLNYDYKGKYLAEFAFRYDGSYRYAPGERWAFFPNASLGWRVSEEGFIKNNFDFVDNLKIRGSIGKSGEDAGQAFQFIEGYGLKNWRYSFLPGILTDGVIAPGLINNKLTWVEIKMYNIGLDFSLFNGLFAMEFDVYQRDRSGLLANRAGTLPNTFGAALPEENINSDRTRGIEFTVSHSNKIGNVQYHISGNFNLARTKRQHIEQGEFKSSYDRWRNQQSNRWDNMVWGYQIAGRFQNENEINSGIIQNGDQGNNKELPGDYIIMDVNGNGIMDDRDKVPLFWANTPMIHYGLNMDVKWKNFDFYGLFQGAANYTVQFDDVYSRMLAFKGGNTPEYFYDRWHREDIYNPNSKWIPGKWPAVRLEQNVGAFYTRDTKVWRKDASYLRLKTVEIGYSFDAKLLKSLGIEKMRIYVNGSNLLTFCNSFVKQFDPERVEGSALAGLNYPLTRTYNFGFLLNF